MAEKPNGEVANGLAGTESEADRQTGLEVRMGNTSGSSFRMKHDGRFIPLDKSGHVHTGRVVGWATMAVLTGQGGNQRFFLLEPASGAIEDLSFREFYVRGPFRVANTINNSTKARDAWKVTKVGDLPEGPQDGGAPTS